MRFHVLIISVIALTMLVSACSGSVRRHVTQIKLSLGESGNEKSESDSAEISAGDSEEAALSGNLSMQSDSDMLALSMESADPANEKSPEDEGIGSAGGDDEIEEESDEDEEASEEADPGYDSGLIPDGWPDDVPVMAGFKLRYGMSDGESIRLIAFGDAPAEEVKQFYENMFGWEKDRETIPDDESDPDVVKIKITLSRDDELLGVEIYQDEEETIFQLVYFRD